MKTRFLRLFLSALVLVLISSGIHAGTYHSGDKKKELKEQKELKEVLELIKEKGLTAEQLKELIK